MFFIGFNNENFESYKKHTFFRIAWIEVAKRASFLAANKRVKSDISGSVDSLNSSGAKVEK